MFEEKQKLNGRERGEKGTESERERERKNPKVRNVQLTPPY